jgi:hypothetical protein
LALSVNIEGSRLLNKSGGRLGEVTRVLYHPSEPRVVGLMVRPKARLYVFERKETYVPLGALEFVEGVGPRMAAPIKSLPGPVRAASTFGYDPDETVIWTSMIVKAPSDRPVGFVHGTEFGARTGSIKLMEVACGKVSDAAYGRYIVDGPMVLGYREGAVRISVEAHELPRGGGAAKAAAKGAVATSQAVDKAGAVVESGMVSAGAATGKVLHKVGKARLGERAAKTAGRTWRNTVDGFRDGMK